MDQIIENGNEDRGNISKYFFIPGICFIIYCLVLLSEEPNPVTIICSLILAIGLFTKNSKMIFWVSLIEAILIFFIFLFNIRYIEYSMIYSDILNPLPQIYFWIISYTLSYLSLAALLLMILKFDKYNTVKKIWFLPLVLIVLCWMTRFYGGLPLNFPAVTALCEIIPFIMICIWLREGIPDLPKEIKRGVEKMEKVYNKNIVVFILLLMFTFGIYWFYWIYVVTDALNIVKDEPYRNPTTKLLLCMFCPFYIIYWTYKTAQITDEFAKSKGVNSDLSTICLIFSIFVPIIPPILIQDKFNSIANKRSYKAPQPQNNNYMRQNSYQSQQTQNNNYMQQKPQNMEFSDNNDELPDL